MHSTLKKIILCIYLFCLCWVFVAEWAFLWLQYMDFSLRWLLLLRSMGSRLVGFSPCGVWAQYLWLLALEHRLSGRSTQAYLLQGIWIFLDQGSNPCLLHWQMDSLLLTHQGSPTFSIFKVKSCSELGRTL